jgi:NADPH-dependent curcumin reductase
VRCHSGPFRRNPAQRCDAWRVFRYSQPEHGTAGKHCLSGPPGDSSPAAPKGPGPSSRAPSVAGVSLERLPTVVRLGETVVVAAAAGPVGSLVGQLAKLAGARAVGIAGGPKKCRSVVEEFRFDAAVDHRVPDFAEKLVAACPNGIDVYFENVGGAIWQAVLPLLNTFARVPVCGLIAQYNATGPAPGPNLLPATMREVLSKSLTLRGYINYEFAADHYVAFLRSVGSAVADGRVRYHEDVTDGLENAPAAFIGMLEGRNFGKALVRVAPSA